MDHDSTQSRLDLTSYATELTRGFIGRQWVFAEIDRWLAAADGPRYFIITGEPGIGKTVIAARLTQLYDLAAIHFCIARQIDTLDPLNFTRSLARQLTRLDGFAEFLLEGTGLHVDVHIPVHANYGQVIGIQIERLTTTFSSASTAFTHSVIAPLKQLYEEGFKQQQLIVVDALDEAIQQQGPETIVDLLANAQGLPRQVRFLLTSRPDSEALRHFEQQRMPLLLLDARRPENLQDVRAYVHSQVETTPALQVALARHAVQPRVLVDRAVTASHGNFLYLAWLLSSIAEGTQLVDALSTLPQGLDGVYREFLRTRIVGKDPRSWRTYYRPLLGALTAAQAPLTMQQLALFTELSEQEVVDVLLDIRQFLDPSLARGHQYRLYHQSIADFLSNEEQAGEFWINQMDFHEKIITFYRGETDSWENVNWQRLDDYGLHHLASHLFVLRHHDGYRYQLYELICRPFMQEKYRREGSHRHFAEDVALAIGAANGEEPSNVAQEVRGSLIYATLSSLATSIPPEALATLTLLGQAAKAYALTMMLPDPLKQSRACRLIGEALLARNDLEEAHRAFNHSLAIAETIKNVEEKTSALMELAPILAQVGETECIAAAAQATLTLAAAIENTDKRATMMSKIGRVFAQLGQVNQASAVAEKIEGVYEEVLDSKGFRLGKPPASEIANRPKVPGGMYRLTPYRRKIQELIIPILAQSGQIDQALAQASQIRNDQSRALVLSELSQILARTGEAGEQAEAVVNGALTAVKATRWPVDKEALFAGIARALAWMGHTDRALKLLSAIKRDGDRARAQCDVAQAIVHSREKERAEDMAHELLAGIEAIKEKDDRVAVTGKIAWILAQCGEGSSAEAIVNELLTTVDVLEIDSSKAAALGQMALLLSSIERGDQAVVVANGALTAARAIENPDRRWAAVLYLIGALVQIGEGEQAVVVANGALTAARAIENLDRRWAVLMYLIKVLILAGQVEQALEIAETAEGEVQKLVVWSSVIRDLIYTEHVDKAVELIKAEANEQAKLAGLSNIAQVLMELGKKEQAIAVVGQVLAGIEAIEPGSGRSSVLSSAAGILTQAGERERAVVVAREALESLRKGKVSGKLENKVSTLSELAQTLSRAGQKEQAIEIARDVVVMAKAIEDKRTQGRVLAEISRKLLAIELFDQALEAAESIAVMENRGFTLSALARSLAQVGDSKRAAALINETAEMVRVVRGSGPKDRILRNIACALAELGQVDRALMEVETIGDVRQKGLALINIALTLVRAGEKDRVVAVARRALTEVAAMKRIDEEVQLVRKIVQVLIQAERIDQAIDLVRGIENDQLKETAYNDLMQALVQLGQEERVASILHDALTLARSISRSSVFKVLESAGIALNCIDQGDTLWRIFQDIRETDAWWNIE
jgi:tetratricopeptide (TPR) repeat protein